MARKRASLARTPPLREADSVPPPVEMPELDEQAPAIPAHLAARRTRFRIVVGVGLGACALLAVVAAGKALAPRPSFALPQPAAAAAQLALPAEPAAQAPAPTAAPPPAQQAPAAVVDSAPAPKAEPNEAEAAGLRKQAEAALNRGRWQEALKTSSAAIDADPTHALGYLFLGTALQSTGKWKAGLDAYSACVRTATRGPVHECRAAGGRK
jgi:tetratricopeptide (TPR) repeat protein